MPDGTLDELRYEPDEDVSLNRIHEPLPLTVAFIVIPRHRDVISVNVHHYLPTCRRISGADDR